MSIKFGAASLAFALSTSTALAGGLDRSGQSIGFIFETGNVVELSYGSVSPSVSGSFMTLPSGDIAPSYGIAALSMKSDLSDKFSVGLLMDEPYGAHVSYETANYPLDETNAKVNSSSITLMGRYKITDGISAHAGLRSVSADGIYDPTGAYASTYSKDSDMGYLVGVAYEKPEIALRVALTYASETEFALDGSLGDLTARMPKSVNLDFQSGVAANTLVFGSVRWADWTSAHLTDSVADVLADYTNDVLTYSLGVGRKFSDSFSGALTLGYEKGTGELASNLSPTDGYLSVGLGGTYTKDNMKITAGVRYVDLGDAVTEPAGAFPGGSTFSGNSAIALGLKVSFSF
jgi:long-subunit fatty acid transport protein